MTQINPFFFYLDDVMCGSVRSRSPQLQTRSMLACFVAFNRYGLKQVILHWCNERDLKIDLSCKHTHGLLKVIQYFTLLPNLSKHRLAKSLK